MWNLIPPHLLYYEQISTFVTRTPKQVFKIVFGVCKMFPPLPIYLRMSQKHDIVKQPQESNVNVDKETFVTQIHGIEALKVFKS